MQGRIFLDNWKLYNRIHALFRIENRIVDESQSIYEYILCTLRRLVFRGKQHELPQLPQHLASFTGRRLRHLFSL